MPSDLENVVERDQPLIDLLFKTNTPTSPPLPDFDYGLLQTPQNEISESEVAVVHSTARWALRRLRKRYPDVASLNRLFFQAGSEDCGTGLTNCPPDAFGVEVVCNVLRIAIFSSGKPSKAFVRTIAYILEMVINNDHLSPLIPLFLH